MPPSQAKKEFVTLKIEVALSSVLKVESRTRYNFWDLLGDVGGFHDGAFLVCSLFMSTYASLAFKNDYIDGTHIESTSDKRVRHFENSQRF
mmetsp:Transcript_16696/g.22518  ORF Transcript_16696/g.22518 Transcript_16696/m.22518 type:complete len:91 (+) Transcript_16696:214-486(+)